jgi:hypothetical protein
MRTKISLLLLLAFALLVRLPGIKKGLPYIEDQDEGIHFGYLVRMLQSGDYNPHEFQKPFMLYSRIPITAIAFLKSVERGDLKKLSEIKTRNEFLSNGFEYTVTHPLLVIYNRIFSLGISLLCLFVTYRLANLFLSSKIAIIAALFLSAMPTHFILSPHVGPDMLVTLLVLVTTYLSIRAHKEGSYSILLLAGLISGLTIATKYNLFTVLLVPLTTAVFFQSEENNNGLFSSSLIGTFFLLFALSGLGFIFGAPYCLLALPEFLNAAAYEVWHYSLAGESLGFKTQLMFFLNRLIHVELGVFTSILALVGVCSYWKNLELRKIGIILISFSLSYLCYMSTQRQQFVRNLLPLMPFLSIFAACGVEIILQFFRSKYPKIAGQNLKEISLTLIFLLLLTYPRLIAETQAAITDYRARTVPDSRTVVADWIKKHLGAHEIASVAGQLSLPHDLRKDKRIVQFNANKIYQSKDLLSLWQEGVSYVVLPSYLASFNDSEVTKIPGVKEKQVIPYSPEVTIIPLKETFSQFALDKFRDQIQVRKTRSDCSLPLAKSNQEVGWGDYENQEFQLSGKDYKGYQWIEGRYSRLNIVGCGLSATRLSFFAFTPWPEQDVEVYLNKENVGSFRLQAGDWHELSFAIPLNVKELKNLEFKVSQAGNLKRAGVSRDNRSLAIALHGLEFK